jgi:serine protease Do
MSRASSSLVLLTTLSVGVSIGLLVGRIAPGARLGADPVPQDGRQTVAADAPRPKPSTDEAIYEALERQYEQFQHVNRTFELVAKVVSPAVVHIVAKKPGRRTQDGHLLEFEETGSGVIVRPDGGRGLCILTNNHVVEDAQPANVEITLHDGRVVRPQRIWSDAKADVAVIKIERNDLPTARLGDSDQAAIGSWVLALGSPFGLTHSVSQGIISARNRHEEELEDDGVENQEFLQTDAAINPGNSGGPLVNMKGEVIGINTAIASNGGGSEGVGFSIPINLAKWIMAQLVATGRVSRGAMGVRLEVVAPEAAIELGLERPRGARITSVQRSSPAAAAGLQAGDVVLRFNGVEVLDYNHLINLVSMTPIGRKIDVVVWRDRRAVACSIVVADREAVIVQVPTEASRVRPNGPLRRPIRPMPSEGGHGP